METRWRKKKGEKRERSGQWAVMKVAGGKKKEEEGLRFDVSFSWRRGRRCGKQATQTEI